MELLKVENVSKAFGGILAINRVSFDLNQGEVLGLIGPNGAGKSTLFNLISGIFRPDTHSSLQDMSERHSQDLSVG